MTYLSKLLLVPSVLLWHIFSGLLARLLIRDPLRRRSLYVAATARHSRWTMRLLGIRLQVEGREHYRPGQNYLIVANHLSYLDVVLMAAWQPAAFVTSVEIKNTPFLGQITDTGGCLYVERRSKDNIHH